MPSLATLSDRYGHFYAPAFSLRVDRQDLVRELLVAVSRVEVDLKLNEASRFSFTVTGCFDADAGAFLSGDGADVLELLDLGTAVEVCMGYGDAMSTPLLMSGIVTEISTSFPEGGAPELSVAGYDHGHLLTLGTSSRTWHDELESNAVLDVARFHNLGTRVKPTQERLPQIQQDQQNDWAFLKGLAEGYEGWVVYVDAQRVLHFGPRAQAGSPVVDLQWGAGLLSFRPQANLAGQVARVEVYGWNRHDKRPLVGVAQAGQEAGLRGRSGGQRLGAIVRDPARLPTLRLRQPVFTQSEADTRARAALEKQARELLTGDGECVGLPDIQPDRNLRLTGLGPSFTGIYYVEQAVHQIDGNGYRTRFNVKEPGMEKSTARRRA